jgi:hypothetical protein
VKTLLFESHIFTGWLLDITTTTTTTTAAAAATTTTTTTTTIIIKRVLMNMYPGAILYRVVAIRKCQLLPSHSEKTSFLRAFFLYSMAIEEILLMPNFVLMFTGSDSLTLNM